MTSSSNDKGGGCPVAVGAGARVGAGAMRDVALATTCAVGGDKTKKKKRPTLFRGGIWNLYKNGLGGAIVCTISVYGSGQVDALSLIPAPAATLDAFLLSVVSLTLLTFFFLAPHGRCI